MFMAILRMRELNGMDARMLSGKLAELRRELTIERSSAAGVGRSVNPGRIRTLKRTIARILTVVNAKGLKLEPLKLPASEQGPKPDAEKKEAKPAPVKAEKKERPGAEAKAGQVKAEISPRISEIMGEVKKVEKG